MTEFQADHFEDLPLWKVSQSLAREVMALARQSPLYHHPSLCAEMERQAVTIGGAIAQGFDHGQNAELLRQLYVARGAAGALRSALHLAAEIPGADALKEETGTAIEATLYCREHLSAWATKLQQAEHRGLAPAVSGVSILRTSG